MHRILILIFIPFINITAHSQSEFGFEQYSYLGTGQLGTLVPVAHYKTHSNWYAEARYNYDNFNTFSLYAGRTFSGDKNVVYSITPMIGGMAGASHGGSLGLNAEFDYKGFNFSSQSQYSVIASSRADNYFFSWSELSYQPLEWLYAGVSLQNTHINEGGPLTEPGLLVGFSYKHVTVPFYSFNPFASQRYFILGLSWEFNYNRSGKKQPVPVLVQNP